MSPSWLFVEMRNLLPDPPIISLSREVDARFCWLVCAAASAIAFFNELCFSLSARFYWSYFWRDWCYFAIFCEM